MMKRLFILLALPLLFSGVTPTWPVVWTEREVRPSLGVVDAAQYCVSTLGYDFGLAVDGGGEGRPYSGPYSASEGLDPAYDNTITLSNASRSSFDWSSSSKAINAVVVQGGPGDNIFYYIPPKQADVRLFPHIPNRDQQDQAINRISFCWREVGENGLPECYQEVTAWAANGDQPGETRYVKIGEWATYLPYKGDEKAVSLYTDRTVPVGSAVFSAPLDGEVTITVQLDEGYIFYYDLADPLGDENLKVQDYKKAPTGVPEPALFEWKASIPVGSTQGSLTVPQNKFYGLYLHLARRSACQ